MKQVRLNADMIPTFNKYLLNFESKDRYGETVWLTDAGFKTREAMMQMYEGYINQTKTNEL